VVLKDFAAQSGRFVAVSAATSVANRARARELTFALSVLQFSLEPLLALPRLVLHIVDEAVVIGLTGSELIPLALQSVLVVLRRTAEATGSDLVIRGSPHEGSLGSFTRVGV